MVNPTGVKQGQTSARKAEIADRQRQVLELTVREIPQYQIARILGIAQQTVSKDLLQALKDHTRPAADAVKDLHVSRAQWALAKAVQNLEKTTKGTSTYASALNAHRAAQQWLARLEGVEAAIEVRIQVESAIDAEIRQLEEQLGLVAASGETGPAESRTATPAEVAG